MRLILFISAFFLCTVMNGQKMSQTIPEIICYPDDLYSVFGYINIGNLKVINSSDLDYNAVLVGDGVVFTSTRAQPSSKFASTAGGGRLNAWKRKLSTLFYSRLSDGKLSDPVPLTGEVNGEYHESSASFSYSGNLMFFTRSSANKGKRGKRQLKIFMVEKAKDQWVNIQEVPFNSDDFSTCHPTISSDGTRLYFSSNRPGGFGGMDIYVSTFRNQRWSDPVNLGPVINSKGNEVFPYISKDEVLYFSSSDQGGLGQLDIFRSKKIYANSERSWQLKQNLGEPFNSPGDDFGFYINAGNSGGVFNSSRNGGKGKDDIYYWQLVDQPIFRAGVVPDILETESLCFGEEER